ncbi:hypothetical protein C8R44DRAFT_752641 [Mycena epipterygia]|nr:hypothetical protein C8R44DRAFT_752641 [Mycena epipterygia]
MWTRVSSTGQFFPPPEHSAFLLPLLYIQFDPAEIPTLGELDTILCDPKNTRLWELRPITGATISLRTIGRLLHMKLRRNTCAPRHLWTHVDMSHVLIFLISADIMPEEIWEEILVGVGGRDELAYLLEKMVCIILARPLAYETATALANAVHLIQRGANDELYYNPNLSYGTVQALLAAVGALDAKEATAFSHDNSYHVLKLLLETNLPETLAYYPAIRQMKKSFPRVLSLFTTATFTASDAFKLWRGFVSIVEQRLQALDFFESGRWMSRKACENIQCGKIAMKSEFKRCSGCDCTYYCSAECQKMDWVNGHRGLCRTQTQILDQFTARDRAYLRALLQYNWKFLSVKSAVFLQQAKFMYENPGVEFFTVFDFAKTVSNPDWIDVQPMSTYPEMGILRDELFTFPTVVDASNNTPSSSKP